MKAHGITKKREFIPHFLGISGLRADQLPWRDDMKLIHELNPEKYYSIEHMTATFTLSPHHAQELISKMTYVEKEFKQNRLTEIHFWLNYYQLGDILLVHNPETIEKNRFYYDMIAVVKETSFSDEAMIDPLQVRKLVWICKPFPEAKKMPNVKMHAIWKEESWWKVIPLKKTK